jgi:hypothetical protein
MTKPASQDSPKIYLLACLGIKSYSESCDCFFEKLLDRAKLRIKDEAIFIDIVPI